MSRYTLLALLIAALVFRAPVALGPTAVASATIPQAQAAEWRGLRIPQYPGATNLEISTDDDEYELEFRSADSLQQVFDFYRDDLVQQGFQVRRTNTHDRGRTLQAVLTRGQGGPDDSVELDVHRSDGRYEVEIEFDD